MAEAEDFAVAFYLRMRAAGGARVSRDAKRRTERAERAKTKPFDKGRDPVSVSKSLDALLSQFAWEGPLSQAELFAEWGEIVGEGNAVNSQPESLEKGLLLVRCTSTAWATSLRLMAPEIMKRIEEKHPKLGVKSIKFIGPDAPNWKRGPRSVPGRGPRDTYG